MNRTKSTSALLTMTLMPMLLLGQWIGLTGSMSALDTTRGRAVAQAADAATDTTAEKSAEADPSSTLAAEAASSSAAVSKKSTSSETSEAVSEEPSSSQVTKKSSSSSTAASKELTSSEAVSEKTVELTSPAVENLDSSTVASKELTSSEVSQESADAFFGVSTEAKDLAITATNKPVSSTPTPEKSIKLAVPTSEQEAATQTISQATPNTDSTATASQSTTELEASDSSDTTSTPANATSSSDSTDYSDDYVDPTDYSIGATQTKRNAANRPSVVLSERSTGCQTVLSAGQGATGSLCGSRTNQAKKVTAKSSKATLAQPVTSSDSIKIGTSGNGITTTNRISKAVLPGPIADSPLNRIVRPSRSVGWSNSATGFSRYSSIKVAKWFAPSKTRLIFPLAIPAAITSAFGWRLHPIAGTWRFHAGTDLGAPMGTPVLAAYAGKVTIADFLGGYGLAVVLNHNQNTQESLYGHLSEILVQPGAWVEQGDVIGRVGSTGNSTGPHLHFEFRQSTPEGWVTVDPGQQLETALAQLVRALQTAQASSQRAGT